MTRSFSLGLPGVGSGLLLPILWRWQQRHGRWPLLPGEAGGFGEQGGGHGCHAGTRGPHRCCLERVGRSAGISPLRGLICPSLRGCRADAGGRVAEGRGRRRACLHMALHLHPLHLLVGTGCACLQTRRWSASDALQDPGMLPASRGELAIRRMGALRRGPSLRAPDRAEEAWRSGDALSAPRAPSRSAACRPYRRDLHRGRTVQRRPRLARPRDGRSRPPPRRRRVAREASGTHSPPREGSSGVVGARMRVPSVGNNQRTSSKRALLRRGDAHARVCAGRIAPPRHPVASHGTRPEGQAPRLGLRPHATLE